MGGGPVHTKAGALPAPEPEVNEGTPTYSKTELLQLRASGIQITREAEMYLEDEAKREEYLADKIEAQKRQVLNSAEEIALNFETAYQVELKARETMLRIKADTAQARAAYMQLRSEAMALDVLDRIPPVATEAEREARLSHPDHDRIHALLRAEKGL